MIIVTAQCNDCELIKS